MSIFRSSSTCLRTSADSAFDSDLTGALSITLIFFDLNPTRPARRQLAVSRRIVAPSSILSPIGSLEGGGKKGLTEVEIVLIVLELDDLLLDQKLQNRLQRLRAHSRTQFEILVAQTIPTRVELKENASLISRSDEKVFLSRVERSEFVSRVLPEPRQLSSAVHNDVSRAIRFDERKDVRVLVIVESFESLSSLDQFSRHLEIALRLTERPGSGVEHENVEIDCVRSSVAEIHAQKRND